MNSDENDKRRDREAAKARRIKDERERQQLSKMKSYLEYVNKKMKLR